MMTEISYSGYRFPPSLAVGAEAPSLLAGLIVDVDGNPMTSTHATKRAKREGPLVGVDTISCVSRG
jgi:hypothetical protein